jgi:hypothetical protein
MMSQHPGRGTDRLRHANEVAFHRKIAFLREALDAR